MLQLFRRHTSACTGSRPRHDRTYRRCKCPIHAEGTLRLDGFTRLSTKETTWEAAQAIADRWEKNGTTKEIDVDPSAPTTLEVVCREWMLDAGVRGLSAGTVKKYRALFAQMKKFAEHKGFLYITQFSLGVLREFRQTWKDSPISHTKKLERLKAFMQWTVNQGWLTANPADTLKAPEVRAVPKLAFTQEDLTKMIGAVPLLPVRAPGPNEVAMTQERTLALIFLMRYSGLRISDAVTFSVEKLQSDGSAFLYMHKTGGPVYVPLPDFAIDKLRALPLIGGKYFFWTGEGKVETATGNARRTLRKLFKLAGIKGHPHRFRHTFAIDLLEKGVSVDDVSTLLGHSSPKITLGHYAPWVKGRQERLKNVILSVYGDEVGGNVIPISRKGAA